jgi:hypothetical protein
VANEIVGLVNVTTGAGIPDADARYVATTIHAATKEPTGFEDPSAVAVSYDSTARTVTLTQTGGVVYWYRGAKYTLASPWTSAAHTATAGAWFLAFGAGGTMSWSSSPWSFESNGPVAYVNYDTPTGTTFALREVHGLMPWQTHQELHETIGTYRRSGGTLTGGTYALQPASPTDADNTPGFDAAVIADEDCPTTVPAWTQGSYTQMRVAAGGAVAFRTAQSFLVQNGTTYPLINDPTTGAETETVTGRYFNCWQILVPVTSDAGSQAYRVLILQPQAAYSTLGEAQSEQFAAMSLGTLANLSPEYVAYAKITLRTNAAYTGATGRCRIEAVAYLTGSRSGSTTTSTGIWEPYLGLPAADGYALTSTTAGVRSWEGVAKLTGDQTVAGSKTLTSPVLFGSVAANQYEQWLREDVTSYPVITYRPTTNNTVCAYDVMPRGTPTPGSFGFAWMDVCNKDVRAGASSVGSLHLEMGSDGAFVSCNAYGSETQQPLLFGIGITRYLELQTTGGLLHKGGTLPTPTSTHVGIGAGWVDAGTGLRGDNLEIKHQTNSTTGNIAQLANAASFVRLLGAAPVIQGIAAPASGAAKVLFIYCSNAVTLKHQDTSATAEDRILSSTGADISVSASKTVQLIYDPATLRWRDVRY